MEVVYHFLSSEPFLTLSRIVTLMTSCVSRATALYFIDKLALRAGNEKDTDEAADTVGCCSLRVEHISKCAMG